MNQNVAVVRAAQDAIVDAAKIIGEHAEVLKGTVVFGVCQVDGNEEPVNEEHVTPVTLAAFFAGNPEEAKRALVRGMRQSSVIADIVKSAAIEYTIGRVFGNGEPCDCPACKAEREAEAQKKGN